MGGGCQPDCNHDNTLPEPHLWNSPLGRRAFLKKTGMATAGTAIALHGFRMEVLASDSYESGEPVTIRVVRWFVIGSTGGRVTIPESAGFSSPPTASEIAAWINANPSAITTVGGLNPTPLGTATTTQNYINPTAVSQPQGDHVDTSYVIPAISSSDITGSISVVGGLVSFSVGPINYRSVTTYNWNGTPLGIPVTLNDPNPPPSW